MSSVFHIASGQGQYFLPCMLLWDHSQLTFELIEGSGESRAWMAWWSLKHEIWVITVPCRGQGVIIQISEEKKRDGTPVIINDDKMCYNQVKSTLFHFLTEFKHIGPFLKSRSFRPFWLLADILAVSVSWPQIRGTALPFTGLSDRFDCWPTFWLFPLVGH